MGKIKKTKIDSYYFWRKLKHIAFKHIKNWVSIETNCAVRYVSNTINIDSKNIHIHLYIYNKGINPLSNKKIYGRSNSVLYIEIDEKRYTKYWLNKKFGIKETDYLIEHILFHFI